MGSDIWPIGMAEDLHTMSWKAWITSLMEDQEIYIASSTPIKNIFRELPPSIRTWVTMHLLIVGSTTIGNWPGRTKFFVNHVGRKRFQRLTTWWPCNSWRQLLELIRPSSCTASWTRTMQSHQTYGQWSFPHLVGHGVWVIISRVEVPTLGYDLGLLPLSLGQLLVDATSL